MRVVLISVAMFAIGSVPVLADGVMKQSPVLAHKAGAACEPGHRGPQRGAGYGYRLGGCLPSRR